MPERGRTFLEDSHFAISTGAEAPARVSPIRNKRKAEQRLRAAMRFAVAANDDTGVLSVTLFAGRRSLTRDLSAAEAALLAQLLSR